MNKIMKYSASLLMVISMTVAACSGTKDRTETDEIVVLDSVSTDLDSINKELDEKAKNVEASLDKIDKEFETVN